MNKPTTTSTPWNGFHHLAVGTRDIEGTVSFYRSVLQMPVSDPVTSPHGRHFVASVQPDDPNVLGLHFWERTAAPTATEQPEPQAQLLLHIALRIPSAQAAQDLHQRLEEHGIKITDIPELGSYMFPDNNGLMLEITWPAN